MLYEVITDTIQQESLSVLEQVMRNTIRENDLQTIRRNIPTLVSLALTEEQAGLVVELVEMASRAALSVPRLHAVFRAELGTTPHAWLAEMRLNRARITSYNVCYTKLLRMPFASRYTVDIATTFLIYVMLGWGLNIVVGLAGLLDLGYVAFYAVGAYSYALLSTELGWSFWVCLPLAGVFAAAFGVMLGFPVLRLRGDYLAIVTLGFGEIIRVVLV